MRQVQHGPNTPPQLGAAYAVEPSPADPPASWQAFPGMQELRADLWPRQHGRCAYCERCVPITSTPIEHIRPKSRRRFPQYTFQYQNLVLSCNTLGTCTDHKADDWDDAFIPPTDARCETWFCCDLNGLLRPADGLTGPDRNAVRLTIQMVNLNQPRLKSALEQLLKTIELACADIVNQRDALQAFLIGELSENDHEKPFFSCKRQYFGSSV